MFLISTGKSIIDKHLTMTDPRIYLVTDAMEHALFARFPWRRYSVGFKSRFIGTPLSVLPAIIVDVVKDFVNPLPKPNCCKRQ